MRILLVISVLCCLSLCVYAQPGSVLTGRVTQEGKPVAGANVDITIPDPSGNKSIRATADANGIYRFENLVAGNYMLVAEGERGKGIAVADISVASQETVTRDVSLTMDAYDTFSSQLRIREAVKVSADRPQTIDEVSKTVNVITGQEMRDRADFTLVDTLRTIPGFRVQQLGGFGRTASIKTRGLRNQDTAVLIDGIRFRDVAAITGDASPFLSDFTLTSVSRVEVLRGSGSSLYGTNAIGGVVDFQTPTPQPGFHGQLSGAAGELGLGRFRGNISDATHDGKFGFNLGVSRTAYTKGIDGQDNAHNTNFQTKVTYQPDSKTNLSGRFFISDAYVRLNSDADTLEPVPVTNLGIIDARVGVNFRPDVDDPDDFQMSKFFNGQFVFTRTFTSELTFQAYYSGLKTSRKNETGALGVDFDGNSTSFFDGLIQTANAHIEWAPNTVNNLTAGYEFEHEKFGNDGNTPDGSSNFFTRAYQSSNTFYVQDLLSLMKGRLNLTGGFRLQQFNLSDPKFSIANALYSNLSLENPPNAYTFDASASYYFEASKTKVRAHVGNGYRVPSLFERFGTFFNTFAFPDPPQFEALGDPNLKPEKTIAFDGGVEQKVFSEKASLTAVYFYTKLTDTIGFGNQVPNVGNTVRPFGGYENQKGGIARGAEFSVDAKPTKATDIFVSYTYTNSDQREPQIKGSGVISSLGIPAHQFTAVATQRIERFWVSFDLQLTNNYLCQIFSGTRFNNYVYRFAGNRRADLTAGYTFPFKGDKLNLRLFGTIENLFDYDYFENGFRTVPRNGRIGLSFGF
jgi:vitamin B12 transporter